MKKAIFFFGAVALLASCNKNSNNCDATGTFEATETIVYAEQNGRLLRLDIEEGETVKAHTEVGLIDTTQLALKMEQLQAGNRTFDAQRPETEKQIAATRAQLSKSRQEENRYRELVADGAAPRKALDDYRSQVSVLEHQLEALKSTLAVQQRTLTAQQRTTDVQISQLRDQLDKCRITVPVSGTVVDKYMEYGELAVTGKPLFKTADLNNVYLRAYLTAAQLENVHLGQKVKVSTDYGNGKGKGFDGTVTWISDKCEFTPKNIPTEDEKSDLVYAVKVKVHNDGSIKMGMYGQLTL